jgi:hypothetical protein
VIFLPFWVSQGELRFIRSIAGVSAEQACRADVQRCYLRVALAATELLLS